MGNGDTVVQHFDRHSWGELALLPENRRGLVIALSAVTGLGLSALIGIASARGSVPDPVATHFGPNGATGYDSLTSTAAWAAVLTIVVGGLVTAAGFAIPGRRAARRLVAGLGVGAAAVIAGIFVAMVWSQSGLADAAWADFGFNQVWPSIFAGIIVAGFASTLVKE